MLSELFASSTKTGENKVQRFLQESRAGDIVDLRGAMARIYKSE